MYCLLCISLFLTKKLTIAALMYTAFQKAKDVCVKLQIAL